MADRSVEGHILIDALLALFLAGVMLAALLGLLALTVRKAAVSDQRTRMYLEERNAHARERAIQFAQE